MVNITINNKKLKVKKDTSILEAAKLININIPTLCFLKDIHEIGACRICVVELKGIHRLVPACNTKCLEGMEIITNSARVIKARELNLQLIFSKHKIECPLCFRGSNCKLKDISTSFSIREDNKFKDKYNEISWNTNNAIIHDDSKCIQCYRCISVCKKIQSINLWDKIGSGGNTRVGVSYNRKFEDSDCVHCGQCILHCPVNALRSTNNDYKKVNKLLFDKNKSNNKKIIVAQVAPAVRSSWGEAFFLKPDIANEGKLVTTLKMLGFDYVFDTSFAADVIAIEESEELLERLKNKKKFKWPMFTSCCHSWVRFIKSQYPDMIDHLSNTKSPHQLLGSMIKTYFAKLINKNPKDIIVVSIMPCVSKQSERKVVGLNDVAKNVRDVDYVLSVRSLSQLIKKYQIDVPNLKESKFDSILSNKSGAGVLFGSTGGVMEAALRCVYYKLTKNTKVDGMFKEVRAFLNKKPWIEITYTINKIKIKVAIISGLANARMFIRGIRKSNLKYDFVEVMACPNGCICGGGQQIHLYSNYDKLKANVLYMKDKNNKVKIPYKNKEVITLYEKFLNKIDKKYRKKLLFTDHKSWNIPLSMDLDDDVKI